MKKTICFIFTLSLLFGNCARKSSNPFFLLFDQTPAFVLEYGLLRDKPAALTGNWGPVLNSSSGLLCVHSHNESFIKFESGPVATLCFDNDEPSRLLLTRALDILQNQHNGSYRPEGEVTLSGSKVKVSFAGKTLAANEMARSQAADFLAGDSRLGSALVKAGRTSGIFLNVPGVENAESTWSLPGFSVYADKGTVRLLFPSTDLKVSGSVIQYLVFEFRDNQEASDTVSSFLQKIRNRNSGFRNTCASRMPLVTEAMAVTGSVTGRFLELTNPENFIICHDRLQINQGAISYHPVVTSGFLFPGGTKVYRESGSKIEGIEDEVPWPVLKTPGEIEITDGKNLAVLPVPSHTYKWNDSFFSWKNANDCRDFRNLYQYADGFCGDPGAEAATRDDAGCSAAQFVLNEINPFGVMVAGGLKSAGKFIEIRNIGSSCDAGSLDIAVDGTVVPLSAMQVTAGSLLTVGDSRYYAGLVPGLEDRNLSFLSIDSTVSLVNRKDKTSILLYSPPVETYARSSLAVSLMPYDNGSSTVYLYHTPGMSQFLGNLLSLENRMSPGEESAMPNAGTARFSEVNWAGSYLSGTSIPGDEFAEISVQSPGTFSLAVNGSRVVFPGVALWPVLFRDKPSCYFPVDFSYSPLLSLPNSGANKLELFDQKTGVKLDELDYDPANGEGLNDLSAQTRKSYAFTKQLFKNSAILDSPFMNVACPATAATPGHANHFEPYIYTETANGVRLIHSIYSGNSYSLRTYSVFPPGETVVSVDTLNGNSIGLAGAADALQYIQIGSGTELYMIHPINDIRIEALQPVPVNSSSEWVLLCNHGGLVADLASYQIKDSANSDAITDYFSRKGYSPPGMDAAFFTASSTLMEPGHCAYLIDPDMPVFALPPEGPGPALIVTVAADNTIGNGIASGESLDLFQNSFHIHSFGNALSHAPFSRTAATGQTIRLKPGHSGNGGYDYEIIP